MTNEKTNNKCQAIIEVQVGTYNLRTVVAKYEQRPCSFNSKEQVGDKCFCTKHAKLAKEGFIYDNGQTWSAEMIKHKRDTRARMRAFDRKHGLK